MINIVAGLIAYSYQEKKPSLNIKREDLLVQHLRQTDKVSFLSENSQIK